MVTPPQQRQRQPEGRAVQAQQRSRQPDPTAGHPGLRQVDQIQVNDKGQQGKQQIPVAGPPRVGGRQADAQQHEVGCSQQHADAPAELPLTACRWLANQRQGGRRLGRQVGGRSNGPFARQDAVGLEAGQHALAAALVDIVALPAVEHEEGLVAFAAQAAGAGRGDRLAAFGLGQDEDIARFRGISAVGALAFDEEDPLAVARGLEHTRRDARQV